MDLELFDEFIELINSDKYCNPEFNQGEIFILTCNVGFEPHGVASEDWELYWKLCLVTYPYYWIGRNDQLQKGATGLHPNFRGRTEDDVLSAAIRWLKLYKEQIIQN